MANKYYFEILDKTLRDIMQSKVEENNDKTFGKLAVALDGNFRQILPAVPKWRKGDIIETSITSSYLRLRFKILALKKNIRLFMDKKN